MAINIRMQIPCLPVPGLTAGQGRNLLLAVLVQSALSQPSLAGNVNLPNRFTAGTPAVASEVNANFDELARGINDNAAGIGQLQTDLNTLDARVSAGVAGPPGPPGPQGPPGRDGAGAGNAPALAALGSLLDMQALAQSFPVYTLDRQLCDSSKISASASVGGLTMQVTGLLGEEALSRPYRFAFIATSANDVAVAALTGAPASVTLFTSGGNRSISGIVSRAGKSYASDGTVQYRISIEPSLSRLRQAHDYAVYPGVSAPDIIKDVLQNAGVSSTMALASGYPLLDMRIMYDQSPFSFIQRLAEENAIAYYFNGDNPVFFDNAAAYPASGLTLSYPGVDVPVSQNTPSAVSYFQADAQTAGVFTANGYDFTSPATDLLASQGSGASERYGFRYEHTTPSATQAAASQDMSRAMAAAQYHYGSSNSAVVASGYTFSLSGSGRMANLNGSYVAIRVRHALVKSQDGQCMLYANSFSSLPATVFAAPPLLTPARKATGVALAKVVGPAGESWHTDQYGRIKIQFLWDRNGSNDDTASAWVRLAMPPNRLQEKRLYLPEIGSEVLVSFLDGNPSLPVVTGSLFNADDRPPVNLPLEKTAAGTSPFASYYYFAYTAGGDNRSLLQTAFKTVASELTLNNDGSCQFNSDETYSLDQTVASKTTSLIDHIADLSNAKFTPVCAGYTVNGQVVSVIVDGQTLEFNMASDWDNGMARVRPSNVTDIRQRLGFAFLLRKVP